MKKIWVFLVTIIICSCDSTDEKKEIGIYVAANVEFSVLSSQNEDLLNPENPNHLDVFKVKLFYVNNGIAQEFYKANLDRQKGFEIFKSENNKEYRIIVDLNTIDNLDKAITYIQWKEGDKDTIEASFEKSYNLIRIQKIWINSNLAWEEKGQNSTPYIILKK